MADHNSYKNRGKPREDKWKDSTIYCEDGVCRTVIVDPDGQKTTGIGCSPFLETVDNYVVQSETIERVYNPHVNEYRHSSPRTNVEYAGHEKWSRPSSPDRPKELDDFFNGIQIEASRPNHKYNNPKPYSGAATTWPPNTNPHSNGYGAYNNKPTTGNYPTRNDKYDDYYRKESPTRDWDRPDYYHKESPTRDWERPDYYRKESPTGDWDRPVNHATRPVGRDAKLGIPTNNIEEAIDYLKGENTKISPMTGIYHGGGGNQTHQGRPYVQPPRVYEAEHIPPRHEYPATPAWPRTSSPPTYGRGYPPGVIDSNEAARLYGGKIVRI